MFFSTDDATLGADGFRVIDQVIGYLQTRRRRGDKLELYVVGHTDHRANDAYNLELADRRAKAVYGAIQKGVGFSFGPRRDFYSFKSQGEQQAKQAAKTAGELADDRKVDVWVRLPPKSQLPRVLPTILRPTSRTWVSHKAQAYNWGDPHGGNDTIDSRINAAVDIIGMWIDGNLGDAYRLTGSEDIRLRSERRINATYRVSSVEFHKTYEHKNLKSLRIPTGEVETWKTTLKYEWGRPKKTWSSSSTTKGGYSRSIRR